VKKRRLGNGKMRYSVCPAQILHVGTEVLNGEHLHWIGNARSDSEEEERLGAED